MAKNGKVGGNGGLLFKLDMETAGFYKSMTGVNKAINLLGRQVKNIDRVYKGSGQELQKLADSYDAMGEQMDAYRKKQAMLNKELQGMSPDTKKYQQTLQEINKVTSQMKVLETQIKQTQDAQAKFNGEGQKLRNELKAQNDLMKSNVDKFMKSGDFMKATRIEQERLRNAIQKTNDIRKTELSTLDKLKERFGSTSIEVMEQKTKINRLAMEHKELEDQLGQTGAKMDYLGKRAEFLNTKLGQQVNALKENQDRMTRMRNSFMSVGAVTTGMAYPMARAIGASVKATVDWEESFSQVRKTVDGTEKDYDRLTQSILDMSKRIPESATEIAETMALAGQMGVPTKQLEGFTEVVSKLGTATNMTTEQATESMAKFANITRLDMTAKNFDALGSTIVNLGNKMAAQESDIAQYMLRLAGAGDMVGMQRPQILALGSAMASVGISAEAGKLFCQSPMKIGA